MRDLCYQLPLHQRLRLTLEDCAMCLRNRDDPFLSASPLTWKNSISRLDTDPEVQELRTISQTSADPRTGGPVHQITALSVEEVKAHAERIYREVVPLTNQIIRAPVAETWLEEHFEYQPHASVARCDIYGYYIQHCDKLGLVPSNPANFGKVVKIMFPSVRTRRIGVRGKSRYHYFGIGPKKDDKGPLVLVRMGKNNQSIAYEARPDIRRRSRAVKTSLAATEDDKKAVLGLLRCFPDVEHCDGLPLKLAEKMEEFLKIYKDHCVQILLCVLTADFYEVRDIVVDFWRNLPLPFITCALMTCPEAVQTIMSCDELMYTAIGQILLPDPIQSTPSGLMQFVKDFTDNFDFWICEGLHLYPKRLKEQKLAACHVFRVQTCRRLQLCRLSTASRFVLHNHDTVNRLQLSLQNLDVADLAHQCNHHDDSQDMEDTIRQHLGKFQHLLINNCELEEYIQWIETVIEDHLCTVDSSTTADPSDVSRELMLQWSYISGQILLQITMMAAHTLGSFHLLDVLFKDYALYYLDKIHNAPRTSRQVSSNI